MDKGQIEPIGDYVREAKASRRVAGRTCSSCPESRPQALVAGTKPLLCARCLAVRDGRSEYEEHHPAGRVNNSATVLVPINDHQAILSPAQYEWPRRTSENRDSSPLLAAAGSIRGFCNTVSYLIRDLLLPAALLLERLDAKLRRLLGPQYLQQLCLDEDDEHDT